MFVYKGRSLPLDTPLDLDGLLLPANWLRLASPEERASVGIEEKPDLPVWDQRFYWGYDENGQLIPKDHGELVSQWQETTRQTANSLLSPTDWQVIREADNGMPMSASLKIDRQTIREKAGEKNTAIAATATTDELAAYITGPDYPLWTDSPETLPTISTDFSSSDGGIS